MRQSRVVIVAVAIGLSLFAAACDGGGRGSSASTAAGGAATTGRGGAKAATVGVILPDTKSSNRWETADRPFLEDAFTAAGLDYDIRNAEGDKAMMATIADELIASGVTILMIVNLDSESGATIEKKAADAGVKTIDYDRLTPGGSATVYVSFDSVRVGELEGQGLDDCLTRKGTPKPAVAVLNGSPTDNNATLLAEGYNSIIKPKLAADEWTLVDDESVPDWNADTAGQIFEEMLTKAGGKIDGVVAANDSLAGAAIGVLQKHDMQVPVTGQDATVDGLRAILTGDQCMTVYKPVKAEADAAAAAAVALVNGQELKTTGTVKDPQSGRDVPAVLVAPLAITIENVKVPIDHGYVAAADVCLGLDQQCEAADIKA